MRLIETAEQEVEHLLGSLHVQLIAVRYELNKANQRIAVLEQENAELKENVEDLEMDKDAS